jgi:sulfate adenylyltransferase subunit 2
MTKKKITDSILDSIFKKFISEKEVWTIELAYQCLIEKGYSKSKRTFERYLKSINFLTESLSHKSNVPIKKNIYSYWEQYISKKRILSLNIELREFNKNYFLFFQDNRASFYWILLDEISTSEILNNLKIFSAYMNQSIVIWPSEVLLEYFQDIVFCEESQIIHIDDNQLILPTSCFNKIINNTYFNNSSPKKKLKNSATNLSHIDLLEAESIHIIRETVSEATNPVMLYSIGKDSAVMLHLAKKAFFPSPPPFPLLHVDTGWKFNEMYQFRDLMVKKLNMELIVYKNSQGELDNINPFDHGSEIHTSIMKTQALKQALDKFNFDFAFGGARRDEEKSRAKERILSFRDSAHQWDPKNQRPELWDLYNFNKLNADSARVFPISNWTELDIWQYIYEESIPIVPLYYSQERPFVERDGGLIMVDDDRFELFENEEIKMLKARFRTLGCYPLTCATISEADSIEKILIELIESKTTERQGRLIDSDSASSMEKKKKDGYF